MKSVTKLIFNLLFLSLCFSAQAQTTLNVVRPAWGPAVPTGKQYYYIPEISGYYDLSTQRYLLLRDNKWTSVATPDGSNPSTFHPVVIDYRGSQPWTMLGKHRTMYPASLPPGQLKRVKNGKGLPPGQAKKQNREYREYNDDRGDDDDGHGHKDHGHKHGKGHDKD